jgi:hypothetical protein
VARSIETLIEGIRSGDEESFLGAGEIARAHVLGLKDTAVLEPYASLYATEPITEADAVAIKSALMKHLRKHDTLFVADAVFALGLFHDSSLVPFIRDCLVKHLRLLLAQNAVVGNLICALDNCGEQLITAGHFSRAEPEKNIADARLYLGKFGLTFPW